MSKSAKLLFVVTAILSMVSIVATYYKYFILEDIETYYDDYGESELIE